MTKPSPLHLQPLQPAGQFLGEELEARGWTQADFAAVVGRPTQFVSEIVTGKKEITRESAAQIGAAFGQSPEFWLSLQDAYLLSEQAKDQASQRELNNVRRRALLNKYAPINTLRKRNVLTGQTLDEIEAEILELFEMSSLEDEPRVKIAARRSNVAEPVTSLQTAWVACVRRASRSRGPVPRLSIKKLTALAAELPSLLSDASRFRDLPDRFAEAGVVLVYVEALPGAKIDGCSVEVDGRPVIGISGRGKRLDKVLFTLLHELAHVVLGHVKPTAIVDELDDDNTTNDDEVEADSLAGRWLSPTPFPPAPARIGIGWVQAVAAQYGVAPIVVVGQLQKMKILEWRSTLAKDAPSVSSELEAW
jgi:HTH-type transcriptional regulator/antitoxin HigA